MSTVNDKHRAMVRRLKKSPELISSSLTYDNIDLMHAALGVAGESGEIVDLVKKHVINGHPLDGAKLVEEIGDLLFYLQIAAMPTGYTLNDILRENIDKLTTRYPEGYSDQASIERRDVG